MVSRSVGHRVERSAGQRCIDALEQWIPTVSDRCRVPAIVVWCGWRTVVAMARTSSAFRHWLDWTCARCMAAYPFNYRRCFTGFFHWPYMDKVIATSLCAACHSQEMTRIGAGQCTHCHTFQLELDSHERHACERSLHIRLLRYLEEAEEMEEFMLSTGIDWTECL